MAFSIQTNVNAMIGQENLRVNQDFQSRTINRLTSGYRINSSADDAAGLSVANKYRNDVTSLMQGVRNANDGTSSLQIVDGGLNAISKMLDRMTTLATQSASNTFEGNRGILDNEYQSLIGEINRQAGNIGLSTTGGAASRYNTNISVYIGGGSSSATAGVSMDLSGASNVVTATGLGLTGTSVLGNTQSIDLTAAIAGNVLDQNSSQTFHFATAIGNTDVTVMGSVGGITAANVVDQLNSGLVGTGISISLSSANKLQITSSGSYGVWSDAKVGAGTAVDAAIANTAAIVNTGKFRFAAGTASDLGTAGQTLSFTPAGGSAINVALLATDTKDTMVNKLRAGLAGSGIEVIRTGNDISFQSNADFAVARNASATSTGGLAGMATGFTGNATAKANTSDPTADAASALALLASAVNKLSTVQGKVGTGLNKLQYAIQLAQSQISNFSAAESRIRDADVAAEAANLTKAQVLQQASMAAMAQANSAPQAILTLLRS